MVTSPPSRSPRRVILAVLALSLGTFLATFDGAAVEMVLPALHTDLHEPISAIQWLMTGYLLAGTVVLLPSGRAGDAAGRAGRGRPWLFGVVVFVVGSAFAAVAPGFYTLLAARLVQALGSAMVAASAAPLAMEVAPAAWSGRALAMSNVAAAAGLVAGPPLGGLLAAHLSWRGIFVISVPVGLTAFWIGWRTLPREQRHTTERAHLHAGEAALSGAALAGLLVALTLGPEHGWTSPVVLATGIAGLLLLVLFLLREWLGRRPLLPLDLLRGRTLQSGMGASFAAYVALFDLTFAMPFFLVMGQRRALDHAGLLVGAVPLGLVLASPLGGWLFDRIGSRVPCVAGTLAVGASLVLLSFAGPRTGALALAGGLVVTGIGLGLFEAPNDGAVIGSVATQEKSLVTAALGTARQLGMTIGVALAATLFVREVGGAAAQHLGRPTAAVSAWRATAGMRDALRVGGGAAVLAAIVSALRPRRDSARDVERDENPAQTG